MKLLKEHVIGDEFHDLCVQLYAFDIKPTRLNNEFIIIKVFDKSGFASAKCWDIEQLEKFIATCNSTQVCTISGKIKWYSNRNDIVIETIEPSYNNFDVNCFIHKIEDQRKINQANYNKLIEIIGQIQTDLLKDSLLYLLQPERLGSELLNTPYDLEPFKSQYGSLLKLILLSIEFWNKIKKNTDLDNDIMIFCIIVKEFGKILSMKVDKNFLPTVRGKLIGQQMSCLEQILILHNNNFLISDHVTSIILDYFNGPDQESNGKNIPYSNPYVKCMKFITDQVMYELDVVNITNILKRRNEQIMFYQRAKQFIFNI